MDLSLGFLFYSTDLYFCLCASTMLSWWLYLCSIVWSQTGWFLQLHSSFPRLLWLLKVFCVSINSVQSLSCVWLFATLWTAACQASLFITNSQSLLRLMSIESVMPPNHLILCRPLLLLPSVFPSIRVFSNESVLCIRWPKYWRFSFSISISSSNKYSGLISLRILYS